MMNSILLKRCNLFLYLFIILSVPFKSYSQRIIPTWDNKVLQSYCIEYDIMDHPTKGSWIVSWGTSKESLKYGLSKEGITYQETDSSIIFKENYFSHHECVFDKMNNLYSVKSFHLFTVQLGIDYSKKLRKKLIILFGKAPKTNSYYDNGIVYNWMTDKCFSVVSSSIINYINDSGLYYLYHITSKYQY